MAEGKNQNGPNQNHSQYNKELKKGSLNLQISTVHQSRCQIYQPTRRPMHLTEETEFSTSWGIATIKGRLGQAHADVFEAIMFTAIDCWHDSEFGTTDLLVDPYQLRKILGAGKGTIKGKPSMGSKDGLKHIMDDIMQVLVSLKVPAKGIEIHGHIVDYYEEVDGTVECSLKKVHRAKINDEGQIETYTDSIVGRKLWKVVIGKAWNLLNSQDIGLFYNPWPLAKLQSGISQAVARHVMTHKQEPNGGWIIDSLLETVGAGTKAELRNRRRELRNDRIGFENLGFLIVGDRLTRKYKK